VREHALPPIAKKVFRTAAPTGKRRRSALDSPFSYIHDEKLPRSLITAGDTLPEPRLRIQAEMIALPPVVPDQPPIPKAPVPLDELLMVAGEFSKDGCPRPP
jgi:hypothetical protein